MIQLKSFLSLLKLSASGSRPSAGLSLAALTPLTNKQLSNLRTKMVISSKSDYPVRDGFPVGLRSLVVSGCSLKRVESRILNLSQLTSLDLSNNSLTHLPDDDGSAATWNQLKCLAELKLSNNKLVSIPSSMFSPKSRLPKTLAFIDVSHNQLSHLPSNLINASNLTVLKVPPGNV